MTLNGVMTAVAELLVTGLGKSGGND